MPGRLTKLLAEFGGTFFVVLVAAGAVAIGLLSPLTVALTYGVAYGLAIATLGRISGGHFNPAVSIAHWVTHRIGTIETAQYFLAQMAGATAAAYALRTLAPASAAARLGPPVLASGVMRGQALLIEGAMTGALVLALWVTVVGRTKPRYWLGGIVAGIVVVAASYLGAPYTGGVMNPARAFGPALAWRLWGYQNVYWVGPLAGGVLAAALYNFFFRRKSVRPGVPSSQQAEANKALF
jgi:glycerol uptake facilitator-like aquaporin